ncbi:hypothetical protein FEF65_09995 [Mariprofundus erugo]|uniref:Uncharacterized protein n=1 Tax=Mariprofundus erugo TaxID=2528639 RepID=A0A5R9GJV2_9PROT|nr:hypothetical protein [Mariprofundus erugo]TLS66490.1 hypothetical protein FEF65_09995 [Mariprofundus erugo]
MDEHYDQHIITSVIPKFGLMMAKKAYVLALTLCAIPAMIYGGEETNYCLDPETNATWAGMLAKNSNDDVVTELFSLRIGLCELVKRKVLTVDRAQVIFEKRFDTLIERRKHEEMLQNNKEGGGA